MKLRIFLLVAIFAIAISCEKENDFTTFENETATISKKSEKKPKKRPFKCNKSSGPFEILIDEACGDFPNVLIVITGEGTATHLGKFTMLDVYCSNAFTSIATTPHEGFMVAANGDTLYTLIETPWDGESVFLGDDGYTHYIYTFEGGSGRFENATGISEWWGPTYLNDPGNPFAGGTWEMQAEGWISY